MDKMLDNKKKKLFDKAYQAYLNITRQIKDMYNDEVVNPFSDNPSITDMICSLDKFLQGCLLRIGVSDGFLSPEELYFILALPDEFDEVCARNKGYKRFIKSITVDSFMADSSKFYDYDELPLFLETLKEDFDETSKLIRNNLRIIFNAFIAIDGAFSKRKSDVALELLNKIYDSYEDYVHDAPEKITVINETINFEDFENKIINTAEVEEKELDLALQELNDLIGLDEVKQEVLSCINLLRINNMRKSKSLTKLQISNHMVFTGHPGTGKTTVARIIAKIYKSLGVVSKGQLVETDRAGLVAGYIGQTALKTAQVIKKAKGGVLFIDEAYSLSSFESTPNDFGREAIDTLVKGMEDYRDDLVVIVAGYVDEMKKFINMNPGLRSRFNKYINFANFSAEEMLDIFRCQCEKNQFILSGEAECAALEYFKFNQDNSTFGNARGVRNFFERVVEAQATRILTLKNPSETEFRTIKKEDMK